MRNSNSPVTDRITKTILNSSRGLTSYALSRKSKASLRQTQRVLLNLRNRGLVTMVTLNGVPAYLSN